LADNEKLVMQNIIEKPKTKYFKSKIVKKKIKKDISRYMNSEIQMKIK